MSLLNSHSIRQSIPSIFVNTKPTWPDPERSIGRECSKISGLRCWEVTGPALEIMNKLSIPIKELLDKHQEILEEGELKPRAVSFHMWMIGPAVSVANPTVVFSSKSRRQRTFAKVLLKESKLLDDYPGIKIKTLDKAPAIYQAANSNVDVDGEAVSENGIYMVDDSRGACGSLVAFGTSSLATLGGVILIDGLHYGISAQHARFNYPRERERVKNELAEVPCFDDDSDSEYDDLIEGTSRGSESSGSDHESDVESSTSAGTSADSIFDAPYTSLKIDQVRLEAEETIHTAQERPFCGQKIAEVSHDCIQTDLDYEIFRLDDPRFHSVNNIFLPTTQQSAQIPRPSKPARMPVDTAVWMVSGTTGSVQGTMTSTVQYIKMEGSRTFQEMWVVHLDRQTRAGDCGAWVIDALTGSIYGHIIAGDPKSSTAYIIPAYKVFDDIEHRFGVTPLLPLEPAPKSIEKGLVRLSKSTLSTDITSDMIPCFNSSQSHRTVQTAAPPHLFPRARYPKDEDPILSVPPRRTSRRRRTSSFTRDDLRRLPGWKRCCLTEKLTLFNPLYTPLYNIPQGSLPLECYPSSKIHENASIHRQVKTVLSPLCPSIYPGPLHELGDLSVSAAKFDYLLEPAIRKEIPRQNSRSSQPQTLALNGPELGKNHVESSRDCYSQARLVAGGREIRILALASGTGNEILQGDMVVTNLDHGSIPYTALSYQWDKSAKESTIALGGAFVHITESLRAALCHIRGPTHPKYLWVDAFCINQTDFAEMRSQILLMRDIYASATRTLVWLGEKSVYSDVDRIPSAPTVRLQVSEIQSFWSRFVDNGPYKTSSAYKKTAALLLCWEDSYDNLSTREELGSLMATFEDHFNYHVETKYLEPTIEQRLHVRANGMVADFADDHDGPSILLIVYYAGDGIPGPHYGDLELLRNSYGQEARLFTDRYRQIATDDKNKWRDSLVWNQTEPVCNLRYRRQFTASLPGLTYVFYLLYDDRSRSDSAEVDAQEMSSPRPLLAFASSFVSASAEDLDYAISHRLSRQPVPETALVKVLVLRAMRDGSYSTVLLDRSHRSERHEQDRADLENRSAF